MSEDHPKYRWPWVVLVIFIFGCVLAVLWMLADVKRVQRIHDATYPPATTQTNR